MDLLPSHIDTTSESFRANAARMERLVAELRERQAVVHQGGGPR